MASPLLSFPSELVCYQISEFNRVKRFVEEGLHVHTASELETEIGAYRENFQFYTAFDDLIQDYRQFFGKWFSSLNMRPEGRDDLFREISDELSVALVAAAAGHRTQIMPSFKAWYFEGMNDFLQGLGRFGKKEGYERKFDAAKYYKVGARINSLLRDLQPEEDLNKFVILANAADRNVSTINEQFQVHFSWRRNRDVVSDLERLCSFAVGRNKVAYEVKYSLGFGKDKEKDGILKLREASPESR